MRGPSARSRSRDTDVGADGLRRLGLRVGEVAEQVQVVDAEKARGRSSSMNFSAPRIVSMPTLTKMPGGSLMLSRAA